MVALLYAIWEQLMFMIMSVGLLALLKKSFNKTNGILEQMSENAFSAYIIHFLVIAVVVIILSRYEINHSLSFVISVVLSLVLSFGIGKVLKPVVNP